MADEVDERVKAILASLEIQSGAIDSLSSLWFAHPNWLKARDDLLTALLVARPGEVIALVGPNRVGKSELFKRAAMPLLGAASIDDAPGMAVVQMKIKSTGKNATFSTKAFARELLHNLGNDVLLESLELGHDWAATAHRNQRISEDVIIEAVPSALRAQRTKYLCLDEIQEALNIQGGKKSARQFMDSYKGLAEEEGVTLVFIGTYPLLDLMSLSTHIMGRLHLVHFQRYQPTEIDALSFTRIVMKYEQCLLSAGMECDLVSHSSYLYRYSLGCTGLLSAWLRRAVGAAVVRGESLSRALLDYSRHPDKYLTLLFDEIAKGEAFVAKLSDDNADKGPRLAAGEIGNRKPGVKNPFRAKPRRHKHGGRG